MTTKPRRSFETRLEAIAADYEDLAKSIRRTLAILQQVNGHHAAALLPEKLTKAIQLRQQAQPTELPAEPSRRPPGFGSRTNVLKRRARTAATLKRFSRTKPRPIGAQQAFLVARKFLEKQGDGYIRTAKPFVINPYAK